MRGAQRQTLTQKNIKAQRLGWFARLRHGGLSRVQLAWLFFLPTVLILCAAIGYPTVRTIWTSLHTVRLDEPWIGEPFVGFLNYTLVLQDPDFWSSVTVSVYFTFAAVFVELLLGLCIALVLNETFRGRGLMRAAILVPWAIPAIVTARMWGWMYAPNIGAYNALLNDLHIVNGPIDVLSSPTLAMPAVILADVWKNTPFVALILLAGLQVIPADLYEAARADGANVFQCFFRITLPLLKGSLIVALLFRTITAFQTFDLIIGLTQGGPGTLTEVLSLHAYRVLFSYVNFGQGSALAVIIAVISFAIAAFYARQLTVEAAR